MNPKADRNPDEAFSGAQRMKATDVMRDRAKRLRQQAAKWNALADQLDEITKYANSQSKDGEDAGPHIGVGSAPEELLWELASRPLDLGL
jgi:hypothetical protein